MSFSISEKRAEEDFDPLFVIQYKAFFAEFALREVYRSGLEPCARSQNVTRFKAALVWVKPNVKVAKVVDGDTGQICAFATMPVYDGNPFPSSEESDIHFPQVEEKARAFLEWIRNTKNNRRRRFKGLQITGYYCSKSVSGSSVASS